jgi:hypothetical protein
MNQTEKYHTFESTFEGRRQYLSGIYIQTLDHTLWLLPRLLAKAVALAS